MKSLSLPATFLILSSLASGETTRYSIGDPTNEEQYYLELVNRARADPAAEGIRIAATTDPLTVSAINQFGVNLDLFKSEMAAIPVQPPLAMNATLGETARSHSEEMFILGFQTHIDGDGLSWSDRGIAAGYAGSLNFENIYAFSVTTDFGHASFEIDWGPGGAGGMQPGRTHRFAIHHSSVKEVGIGIYEGSKQVEGTLIGPQLVTQDFGTGPVNTAFVTGVVYHDLNENNFYDPGEGVGGVLVDVGDGAYAGITASSGGYAVPVPSSDATYDVEFRGPGIQSQTSAVVSGGANVKRDLVLDYDPPEVIGSVAPAVGIPAMYEISPVLGASSYEWKQSVENPAASDSAEDLDRVTATGSDTYPMIATNVKHQGARSYQLFHDNSSFREQALTYNEVFQVDTDAAISFRSRLGLASLDQLASIQASVDGDASWTTLWSQSGTNTAGETNFQLHTVPLTAYAGQAIRLRLHYSYPVSGSIFVFPDYPGTPTGWFVDQVEFTGVNSVSEGVISPANLDGSFEFEASSAGERLLSVRPLFPNRTDSFGPPTRVTPSIQNSYVVWATLHEGLLDLPAKSVSDFPEGDINGDGVANVMAYALGFDPMTRADHRLPKPVQDGAQINIDYTTYPSRTDLDWQAEAASILGNWMSPGEPGAPAGFSDQVMATDGDAVNRRATLTIGSDSSAFMRLRAELK